MDIDDMEDWLELQDPEMQEQIAEGYKEYRQGKTRPLDDFLTELHASDQEVVLYSFRHRREVY